MGRWSLKSMHGQPAKHRIPAPNVQIGVDENDQNAAQNLKGTVEAVFQPDRDNVAATPLAPYSEVRRLRGMLRTGHKKAALG